MNPLKPENESARLLALQEYRILDTAPEKSFDDYARLAALICGQPTATISLVDGQRQWFKAKVGIECDGTGRDQAFCAHAILNPNETMVVSDALTDEQFFDHPLVVGDPHLRFYAGSPLVDSGGFALGTICAIGYKPGTLSDNQREALECLSRRVVEQIELRDVSLKLADALREIEELEEMLPICSHCRKIRSDDGYWATVEGYLEARSTARFTHGICPPCAAEHFPDVVNSGDFDPDVAVRGDQPSCSGDDGCCLGS